jgi:hypothetical protein
MRGGCQDKTAQFRAVFMREASRQAEKELYANVRELANAFTGRTMEESYAFNKLQQQVEMLKTRRPDEDGYVNHIASFLNSIVDYRQEDEERRRHVQRH